MMDLKQEFARHLSETILPFWTGLQDQANGGTIGYVGFNLKANPSAAKGCIMNSRILWFFSAAYTIFKQPELLLHAEHAYLFFDHFVDQQEGGLYWLCTAEGNPLDETKHTYNHAFAVYALAAFAQASGSKKVLSQAIGLFDLMETRMVKDGYYLEAFDRIFRPLSNVKLSDNPKLTAKGVIAEKTMNTMLHVMEAYTLLYEVSSDPRVGKRLRDLLRVIWEKVYNPGKNRLEVFFDSAMNSLLDMHSYGHDIEASWLIDLGADAVLTGEELVQIKAMTTRLALGVLERALQNGSLINECVEGQEDPRRFWWVQAETMVGMANLWKKTGDASLTMQMQTLWRYIKENIVDPRPGGEWYAAVGPQGEPMEMPIAQPWKAPYHNGRMCMEMMKRL